MDQATKLDRYRAAITAVLQMHAVMEAEPGNHTTAVRCDGQDLLEAGIPAEDIEVGFSHGRPLTLAEAA